LGNPMSSMLSIQLGDQDGNFQITAPCLSPTLGCDAPVLVIPGGNFSVSVVCKPQSIGAHMALLYIVGSGGTKLMPPISLSCMGTMTSSAPALSVNPGSVSLMHEVGMGSASTTIHVGNVGNADLHIASIALAGNADWSYTTAAPCASFPCTLVPTATFDITATFTPTALFVRDATLTINSDDPSNAMFQVPLAGTGQGALLRLASTLGMPPMLDLGTSPIGISTTATFDLGNNGNITLDPVNLAITQAGSEFSVSPNPTSINASGTRQITVTCTPTAASLYTGTIDITAPTAKSGSPISIDVRCTGTSGNLFATPSSVQLGEIRVGSPRVTRTIMLKTAGPDLAITSNPSLAMPVSGMAVTAPSSMTIKMAMPATFDLTIDATADEDLANQINVTATAPLAIPVTGKVVTAKIDVPATLAVGSFCVGQPTTPTPATLVATGTATIGLGAQPVMNRMSTSPFQLTYTSPVSYPYQLPAGQSAAVNVIPLRQTAKGTQVDDLVWTTDVVGQAAPHTTVSAEFIAEGGAIAPQLVDFGAVELRDTASPRSIKIQNCGTEPMTLSGPTIEPSGEFRDASATPLPQTLAPNQVATIEVTFAPKKIGLRNATLTVDSSKGPLGVMLAGQGHAAPGTTTEPRSFYACDCRTSDPTSAWPALLVFVVLRRRRRR
jgi:MYXO-CTERM domain-containing protein